MMKHLKNVNTKQLRRFLEKAGHQRRIKGGHEYWTKEGVARPVTFQTHVEPVPEFIVKQILNQLSLEKEDFWAILES